jgi:hypothetical protein
LTQRPDDHRVQGHREQVEHAGAHPPLLTLRYRRLYDNHVRVLPRFFFGNQL